MSANEHLQPRLFDPGPKRPLSPEEKGPSAWYEHHAGEGTLAHHATFRDDWRSAPTVHAGTIGQASYRLDSVATTLKHSPLQAQSYYDASTPEDGYDDDGGDEEPITHTGRVYAFRMSGGVHSSVMSDKDVNDADYLHQLHSGAEDWEISRSVKESLGTAGFHLQQQVQHFPEDELPETTATKALERGKALPYRNTVESDQNIDAERDPEGPRESHLVPRQSVRTWEDDVLANPHASELAHNYARQRVENRSAGSVAFPSTKVTPGSGSTQAPLDQSFGGFKTFGGSTKVTKPGRRTLNQMQFTIDPANK